MAYKRLIMTRGLPGSGKSTWAEQERVKLEGQGAKVFISNKDDLRKALTASGWTWSPDAEKDVIKIQNSQIKSAFSHGSTVVIVADTNFGRHEDRLRGIAKHCGADFEIKDFTDVPLATCIERDARRERTVGAEVIREMYNKYVLPNKDGAVYRPDESKPLAIICDIDGTVAIKGDRSPFDYSKVDRDFLNVPVADIVQAYAKYLGYTILYVSGREDSCRQMTEKWLSDNMLPVDAPHMLLMRKAGDYRKDYIVKQEIFDNYLRDNYNVKFVLDDRNQVVTMWRRLGLTCLQVAEGAF